MNKTDWAPLKKKKKKKKDGAFEDTVQTRVN